MNIEIKGNMDAVVDTSSVARVRFSYPLTKPVVAELTNPGPWTRGQLIAAICDQYQAIYAEEAETSKVAVGRASARLRRHVGPSRSPQALLRAVTTYCAPSGSHASVRSIPCRKAMPGGMNIR